MEEKGHNIVKKKKYRIKKAKVRINQVIEKQTKMYIE